jgi:hypothetical protein
VSCDNIVIKEECNYTTANLGYGKFNHKPFFRQ